MQRVGRPGLATVLQQIKQFGQRRPCATGGTVGRGDRLDPLRLVACSAVVIHQCRTAGCAVFVTKQQRGGGAVDADCPDPPGGLFSNPGQHSGDSQPPVLWVLLAGARCRMSRGRQCRAGLGDTAAVTVDRDRATARGAEVDADIAVGPRAQRSHGSGQVDGLWRRPVIGAVLGDHVGIDATAHVELGSQPHEAGRGCGHQVIEDAIGHGLVKCALVAE